MLLWNYKGQQNTVAGALKLSIPEHAVISLVGSGGKTTLLSSWGRELAASGKKVVLTTTAHMGDPLQPKEGHPDPCAGISVLYTDGCDSHPDTGFMEEYEEALEEHGLLLVVSHDPDKPFKVMSPPEWIMDHICRTADAVIIEADGSRRLPLKWPAPWEPVVPENTDITVCIAGLSGLGRKLSEVVYRYEYMPDEYRLEKVDETLLSAMLASPDGGQKDARGEFRVFLNQADSESLQAAAARIQMILGIYGIQSAWGSLLSDAC